MTPRDAVWRGGRLAIRLITAAITIVIGLTAGQGVLHANEGNLIQNGSFESGVNIPDNPGYLPLSPGSTAINNWTVIRGGIDYYGVGWVASDGHRSLDLNGTPGVGGVAQTFATTPGQKYRVSFDMAGHISGLLQTMRVNAAGQSEDFTFQSRTDPNDLGWQRRTWEFTANAPSTTLEFYSLQTGYPFGGPALDNVSVAEVGVEQRTSQMPPPSSKGQVCTFYETADASEITGTLYATGDGGRARKRSDINMKFPKSNTQIELHLIIDSIVGWIWGSSDTGIMTTVEEKSAADILHYSARSKCRDTMVNNTVFKRPSNINFIIGPTVHFSETPWGKAPNLIVLVHGCCTNANDVIDDWYTLGIKMGNAITNKHAQGEWEIAIWDWHACTPKELSTLLSNIGTAYSNARSQGLGLAEAITQLDRKYKHIHLIAHSAGSRLIDVTAKELVEYYKPLTERPFIHLTFLDAYTQTDEDSGKTCTQPHKQCGI